MVLSPGQSGVMNIEIQTVLSQNITIVFDSLDLTLIDFSKLKNLRGDKTQPVLMDTPEMVVAIFPPEPLIVQIGDKRIRLTLQGAHDVGSVPLWDFTTQCTRLVPKSKSNVIAYGFNYEIRVMVHDEQAIDVIQERFLCDATQFEQGVEGDLQSFTPRFKYTRKGTSYDLILEPTDGQHVKAHLNAHFASQNRLPSPQKLKSSYLEEYQYFTGTISKLLEER